MAWGIASKANFLRQTRERPIVWRGALYQTLVMNHLLRALTCTLALICLYPSSLLGDSFRCGRQVISTGDSSGELLRVCGEPFHKDRGRANVAVGGLNKSVSVERWYYKKSRRSLEHIIIVYRGRVESVEVGSR